MVLLLSPANSLKLFYSSWLACRSIREYTLWTFELMLPRCIYTWYSTFLNSRSVSLISVSESKKLLFVSERPNIAG